MTELPAGALRRRGVAIGVTVVVAVVGIGVAAYTSTSPRQAAADAEPPEPSTLVAEIESRELTETVILRGVVEPVGAVGLSIVATTDAPPVVTALPKALGDPVAEGDVVLEVSGRPVLALQSTAPFYRDIQPMATGADVEALQEALARQGFSPSRDGTFDGPTQEAVRALYERAGYEASDTGKESFEQLRAARGAAEDAEEALAVAEGALAEQRTAGAADTVAEQAAVEKAERLRRDAEQVASEAAAAAGVVLPRGEVVAVSTLPGLVSRATGRLGAALEQGTSPIEVSTGGLVVAGELDPAQAALVEAGQPATFDDDMATLEGTGTVESVGPGSLLSAGASPGEGEGAVGGGEAAPDGSAVVLRVAPDEPLPAEVNGRSVRIKVEAATTGGAVAAVPISAVRDTAEGEASIVLHPSGEEVVVETGLVAGGWVEVRAPDLEPGTQVRIG